MYKLLKFYSSSCNPCKILQNLLSSIKDIDNLEIIDINIDSKKNENLIKKYEITQVPSLILLYNNEFINKINGLPSRQTLESFLKRSLKLWQQQ